jgi:hypothetical protein
MSAVGRVNLPTTVVALKLGILSMQAAFLAVALSLEVPILSADNNVVASMNPAAAGSGACFLVSRSVSEFEASAGLDSVTVKLCDFGSAVILSVYEPGHL